MKQLSVVVRDKPGLLARIAHEFGAQRVDLESISLDTVQGLGLMRVITSNNAKAKSILLKMGFPKVTQEDVFILKVADKPGALAAPAEILASNGVSIYNAFLFGKDKGKAHIVLNTSDNAKAKKLLRKLQ